MIVPSGVFIRENGCLDGENVTSTVRRLKDLKGVFMDESAFHSLDPDQVVYEVKMHDACGHVEGGLFFGTSFISPGKVGLEYFMTKGHFHEKLDRGEYYWGISGQGILLMMDQQRTVSTVKIESGSLHYVPGHMAHRVINTGDSQLVVGACWPADAGHNYDAMAEEGFPVRIIEQNHVPILIKRT
jgi:glucose-6-phosphate isomerase